MGFASTHGYNSLNLGIIHQATLELNHCTSEKEALTREINKNSDMFRRAYDNLEYEFDADGDGMAEDSSSYRYEKEKIAREEEAYDAEVANKENMIAQRIIVAEAKLAEAEKNLENGEKMQDDSTKSFGYMNIS